MPQLKGKHAKEFRKKMERVPSEETKRIFEEAEEISKKIKHEEISPETRESLKKMRDIINLPPDQMKKKLDEIERKHST